MTHGELPVHRRGRPATLTLRLAQWGAAAALVIVGALRASGQQDVDQFAKLDPKDRFVVESAIDSAQLLGLPFKALQSTVLEGIRKNADSHRIANAVRDQLARLKVARSALGAVGDEELVAAAAVLRAGAKPAQLSVFKQRQKGRTALEAFTDWADLITRGVPSEDASSAISKLWQEGADDVTFHRLWNDVQGDISLGLNPGAALQNRIREAPGRPPTKPTPPEGQQENQSSR